jgi:hypothetical protein
VAKRPDSGPVAFSDRIPRGTLESVTKKKKQPTVAAQS